MLYIESSFKPIYRPCIKIHSENVKPSRKTLQLQNHGSQCSKSFAPLCREKKIIVSAVLSPCVPSYDDHAKRCHSSFHPFSLVFSYNVFSSALMHTYMVFTFSCIIIPFRSFVPSISHVFNLL